MSTDGKGIEEDASVLLPKAVHGAVAGKNCWTWRTLSADLPCLAIAKPAFRGKLARVGYGETARTWVGEGFLRPYGSLVMVKEGDALGWASRDPALCKVANMVPEPELKPEPEPALVKEFEKGHVARETDRLSGSRMKAVEDAVGKACSRPNECLGAAFTKPLVISDLARERWTGLI